VRGGLKLNRVSCISRVDIDEQILDVLKLK